MARALRYVRPVDAVLMSIDLGQRTYPSADGVRIKEEPPDFDDLNVSLTDVDTVGENVSTKPVRRRSSTVNTEKNLIRDSSKNHSVISRRKRKRSLNNVSDLQCVGRQKRRRSREIKNTPSKDSTNNNIDQEVLCNVCFVPFFSQKKLTDHTQRYRTLMSCEYCSAPFNLRSTLYRHKLVHFRKYGPAPRAKLECYFCERRFDSKKRVQMHLFHCHGNVIQPYSDADKNTPTNTSSTRVINDEERICREDTTARMIDDAEDDICLEDTMIIINSDDEAEKDTCLEDTMILMETDINKLEEDTRMVDIMNIIGVPKNIEDNTSKDERNCVPNNAEPIIADHTIRNVDDVDRNDKIASIDSNMDILDIVGVSKNIMNFCADKPEENAAVTDTATPRTSDLEELEKQGPTKRRSRVAKVENKSSEQDPPIKRRGKPQKKATNNIGQSTMSPSTAPTSTTPTSTPLTRSPTNKKMRQTTLLEFLSFSGKNLKQDGIKTERVDDIEASSSVSDRNTTKCKPAFTSTSLPNSIVRDTTVKAPTNSTPLLRMHMDPDSIIDLLNDQIKSEPLDIYDSNVSQNSPYNLRKIKHDSCRSSPNLHDTMSPVTSHVMSPKRRSRSTTSKRTPKPKVSLHEKLRTKYKCKDCVVRLERCDYTSKRVIFKTDMSKSSIPVQLTIGRKNDKDSLNDKQAQSSSPTIRIVKLENCIVVEVIESR